MKKVLRILGKILMAIIIVILAAVAAMQSPKVQTYVGRKVAESLRSSTDADIQFKMVSILPFKAITLDDVVLIDRAPVVASADTILNIGSLSAKFSIMGLARGNGAYVSQLKLTDAVVQIVMEPLPDTTESTTNIQRVFGLIPSKDDEPSTWGNLLNAREINIQRTRVKYIDTTPSIDRDRVAPIDFANLDVTIKDAVLRNLKLANSHIIVALDRMMLHENKADFTIYNLAAQKVDVGEKRVRAEKVELVDRYSNLHLNLLQMDGAIDNYNNFIDKIRLKVDVAEGSLVSMKTVSYLSAGLEENTFRGNLNGKVEGYVNDLLLKNVFITDKDNNMSIAVNGRVMNATDVDNLALDLKFKPIDFTLKGLNGFIKAWAPGTDAGLGSFAPGERFKFEGTAKGPINRLAVNGVIGSGIGSIKTDIVVRNTLDLKRAMMVGGVISTKDLNIGKIAGIDAIGPVTLGTGLMATLPRKGSMQVKLDSLNIRRLNALGYDYKNISAVGEYAQDAFDGRIIASDPNLNFLFQGRFNLSTKTKNQVYRFYASLGYADLHALKIDKRPNSKVSFQTSANFLKTDTNNLLGDINLTGITLVSETGTHNLGDLTIKAHGNDNVHRIKLNSKFLEGSFIGDKAIFNFVNDLKSLTLDRELSALVGKPSNTWDGASYKLKLKVTDARDLLEFLAPGTYVDNPSELTMEVDENGLLSGKVVSGRIALNEKFIKDLDLSITNANQVLAANIEGSSINISKDMKLLKSRINLFANDNHVGVGYTFDNSEEEATKAELYLSAELSKDHEGLGVSARALPSNLYYKGDGWGISSGDITFKGGNLKVDALRASHDSELLEVDGGFSSSATDTLNVKMEKFNLGIISSLTGGTYPIGGLASGAAVIISPGKPFPGIEANMICDSTMVAGERLGKLAINSKWNAEQKRFDMDLGASLDGTNPIKASGYLVPEGQVLSLAANLDRFPLGCAYPFLDTIFSTFDGHLSGAIQANGPLSKLKLTSQDLNIDDGHLALDYTRAVYDVSGPLGLDEVALHLNDVLLKDKNGGVANVSGDVIHNGLKSISTNLHIGLNKFLALDLKKGENPTLFGYLPVSGTVDVNGPVSRIVVDVNATTRGQGELHLPIGSSSGERERDMLVFTPPRNTLEQDPYELMMSSSNVKKQSSSTNLIINLTARATPDATVYIDLGENTLDARGNGNIGINVQTAQSSFNLMGDYTLQEGSFRFSAMNLVSRDFTIQDGSSVRFNGPVSETDLDVKGLYVTKASISNLLQTSTDSESTSSRRIVNCGIDITGKLKNPQLQFSIDIPDLNPSTKLEVENAFSTEDKVQKQFLYLLIAGGFLPEEDTGITNTGSDMLFSNVSSIMSGQINNIFEKLNIPLGLGLNYKNKEGKNMFDVALSTQLFNNRVIVNGAVGNKQTVGSTTSEITGDVEVEVKINRTGTLRASVFSHSADQFSSYLDNSQRNGAGITYQREFNSFLQLLRYMFDSRKEREERLARGNYGPVPQTQLQIDSTGKSKVIENE